MLPEEKICYTESMVDGTRQYRGKNSATTPSEPRAIPAPTPNEPSDVPEPTPSTTPDAGIAHLDRRAWFGSLVPALGDGLVKILRASNNLKRDVHELVKEKADDLLEPPASDPEK